MYQHWLNFIFSIDWIRFSFLQGWLYFWIFFCEYEEGNQNKNSSRCTCTWIVFQISEGSITEKWVMIFFCVILARIDILLLLYKNKFHECNLIFISMRKIKLSNLYPKLTWNLHQVLISIIVVEFYILVKFQLCCIWFYNGRHHTSHFSQLHFEWLVPYHILKRI